MISVALAGSTSYSASSAKALASQTDFTIPLVITPTAKPSGRNKQQKNNPLALFAENTNTQIVFIQKKISPDIKNTLSQYDRPDFLLVIDFGYWIPKWLRVWPRVKTLNIHPSQLPRWRGSSPGQFSLLNGEKNSAVSLIEVVAAMDAGPLYWQKSFAIEPTWTQTEYYHHAFSLVEKNLPQLLRQIYADKLSAQPQPIKSPTPLARKLTREDGFVSWDLIKHILTKQTNTTRKAGLSELLAETTNRFATTTDLLQAASLALSPWPQLWTIVPTRKGPTRMKILSLAKENKRLVLYKVQLAGQQPAHWQQIKTAIME